MIEEVLSCDFCGSEKKILITYPNDAGEWRNGKPATTIDLCTLCALLPSGFRRNATNESLVMIVGFNYLAGLLERVLEGVEK